MKYWLRNPVLGFGVGAHSWDGRNRYANYSSFPEYLAAAESDRSPVEWSRAIDDQESLQESLFLGLRLIAGIDWNNIECGYDPGIVAPYRSALKELDAEGLVAWTDSVVKLTEKGMLLSNEVFQRFV